MNRPIDEALAADRPAKRTVRNLWLKEVNKYPGDETHPLYLTLPGAEGKDIQLLIDNGIVSRTETGAISAEDQKKIVAIESNSEAVLSLQRKFPGLKIRESAIEGHIGGDGLYNWPNNEIRNDFCARVVNIDLDKPLKASVNGEGVQFPLIKLIKKISQLHHEPPVGAAKNWSLCVTVNSTTQWGKDVSKFFLKYLAINCDQHPTFKQDMTKTFGQQFVDDLQADNVEPDLNNLSHGTKEKLLCIFLPKIIIDKINDHNWLVEECTSLHYGGTDGHAAMSTLTISLCRAQGAATNPAKRYETNLGKVIANLGAVDINGTLTRYG